MMAAILMMADLHAFHDRDRELFSRLVVTLGRDPAQSLLVMALWLWLEDKGNPCIMQKLLHLPLSLTSQIADEAAFCLCCLQSSSTSSPDVVGGRLSLPITSAILETPDLSILHFITRNKFTVISGVKRFLKTVCAFIFADILEKVVEVTSPSQSSSSRSSTRSRLVEPNGGGVRIITVPGFPHPVFGELEIVRRPPESLIVNEELWRWDYSGTDDQTAEEDRTMFLTFSRGFPVTEKEVRELFTGLCGQDCIEAIIMELALPPEQPLYARMVLRSVTSIDVILKGKPMAKYRINGKHIWTRKFEKRETPTSIND